MLVVVLRVTDGNGRVSVKVVVMIGVVLSGDSGNGGDGSGDKGVDSRRDIGGKTVIVVVFVMEVIVVVVVMVVRVITT